MRMNVRRANLCAVSLLLIVGRGGVAAADDTRVVDAMARQDKAAVRTLLKQGVNVNTPAADGATALLWAAHWDDVETVDLLLKAGAKVDASDDHGVTPLAQACSNANVRMVTALLDAKANPNLAQTSGVTPLIAAMRVG